MKQLQEFLHRATGCGEIAYCLPGYFILCHPVYFPALQKFHQNPPITVRVIWRQTNSRACACVGMSVKCGRSVMGEKSRCVAVPLQT